MSAEHPGTISLSGSGTPLRDAESAFRSARRSCRHLASATQNIAIEPSYGNTPGAEATGVLGYGGVLTRVVVKARREAIRALTTTRRFALP
jgi:hypothetical protein